MANKVEASIEQTHNDYVEQFVELFKAVESDSKVKAHDALATLGADLMTNLERVATALERIADVIETTPSSKK